ncbi:hypothetical protein K505DRAFT_378762 [Melanomma pulvis-pyrius CBS 109.77]|uniref:Uncharacterized protein n=1 Tax=Melanomma pulvis-pyrius CBS 109.77 TaxID=1314802 RepID=A0A6A6WX20_9PLEO|nr:hypothetical protein K505DRAFT_378762 [Melanomma pulvis-pyrius CBS 109.77]
MAFAAVTTTSTLAELAREISVDIANDQADNGKATLRTPVPTREGITNKGVTLFELPWTAKMERFTSELPKAIVKDVQRLVGDIAGARMRNTRPDEYRLPPAVFRAEFQNDDSWLEILEDEIVILQPFNNPANTLQDAKLRVRSDETKLEHSSVILVIGRNFYRPYPADVPLLTLKMFMERRADTV